MATLEQLNNFVGPAVPDPKDIDISLAHIFQPKKASPSTVWDSRRIEKARSSLHSIVGLGDARLPSVLQRASSLQDWWATEGRYLPRGILNQLGIDPRYKTERDLDNESRRQHSKHVKDFLGIVDEPGDPLKTITTPRAFSITGKTPKVVSPEEQQKEQQKQESEAKLRGLSIEDLEFIKDTITRDILSFDPELGQAVDKEIDIKKRLPLVLTVINERPLTILLGTDFFNSLAGGLPEFTSRKGINPAEILFGIESGETAATLEAVSRVREMILAEDPRITTQLALGLGDTLADLIKFTLLPDPSKAKVFARLPKAVKAAIGVGSRAGMVELLKAPTEDETTEDRFETVARALGIGAVTGAVLSKMATFLKDIPVKQQAARLAKKFPGLSKQEAVQVIRAIKEGNLISLTKTPKVAVARRIAPTGFRSGAADITGPGKFGKGLAKGAGKAAAKGEQQIAAAAAKLAGVKPIVPKKVVSPEQAGPFGPGFEGKGEVPFRVIVDPKIRQSVQTGENAVARLKTRLEQQKAKGELVLAKKTLAEIEKRQRDIEKLRVSHEVKQVRTVAEAKARIDKMRRATEFKAELRADAVSMMQAIPKELRPDFVRRATAVKTTKGVAKLAQEIDERLEKFEKRQAIVDVTKTFKEIEKATRTGNIRFGKVPSPQREKLIALRDSVDFQKLTEAKQSELESLQNHVQRMAIDLSGELSALDKSEPDDPTGFVPKRVIEQLRRLSTANINEMSTEDIRYLGVAAQQIAHEAGLKSDLLVRQGLKPLTAENTVKNINESVALTRAKRKELAKLAGGTAEEMEVAKLAKLWRRYKAAELDLEALAEFATSNDRADILRILSSDVQDGHRRSSERLIQILDIFSEQTKTAGLNKMKQLEKKVSVTLAGRKVNLTLSHLVKLERHFRSPDNLRAIATTTGWASKDKHFDYPRSMTPVDRIVELNNALAIVRNDPMLLALAGDISDNVNVQTGEAANEALLLLRGHGFPLDKNYTSRNRWIEKKVGGRGINSVAGEDLGMFLPRAGGTQRIKLERWDEDILRQIETSAYLHGMAVPLRNARIVVQNPEFQATMIANGHKETLDKMLLMLQRIQGAPTDASMVDQFGRFLQRSVAIAGLGFRVSSGGTATMSFPAIIGEVSDVRAMAVSPIVTQGYLEKMWADSAILDLRARGHRISAEVGIAGSADAFSLLVLGKSSSIADKSFFMVQDGDNTAIGMIHKVAANEVVTTARNGKNVKPFEWDGRDPADLVIMTSEFEGGYPTDKGVRFAAARRAEFLVRRTQPMYDMLNRSAILSDPSTLVKTYSVFRSALNAQWKVFARGLNQYSKSDRTLKDKAKFTQHLVGLGIAATAVAVWKNYWRWSKDSGIKEAKEAVGIFTFDADRDLRTADEEIKKLGSDAIKNLGQLSTLGKYMMIAGELAANQLFGEGYNWNRNVFDNPALELAQESAHALTTTWPEAIAATKVWADNKDALDELGLTADEQRLRREFAEEARKQVIRTWKNALASALDVGVRLAQVPAVAPYQEWIKPALKGTKIKIIREVTPNDIDDPATFAENVNSIYALRSVLKAQGKKRALTIKETKALSGIESFISKLNNRADRIKNIGNLNERRVHFQMISSEVAEMQREVTRQLQ